MLVAVQFAYAQQRLIITRLYDVKEGSFDTTKLSKRAKFTVRFSRGEGRYAFDEGREEWLQDSKLLRDEYYKRFGENYVAPWKLIPVGETDRVSAALAGPAEGVDRSKIKFVTAQGKGIAATDDGQAWTLTVPSTQAGKTVDIYAVYEKNKSKLLTVGKLRVVSYSQQHHTVTLIPVGVEAPDAEVLETQLNGIYAPYGVSFTVKTDESIKDLEGWKGRTFKLEGNGFFTRENADMAEIRKAYQAQKSTPKGSYYVFVLGSADASSEDKATQTKGAQGDMPRGQQFGYVFGAGVEDWGWLLAHELGHGVFTLQHLEDGNYGAKGTLGSVSNLMNYTRSTELQAFQWNIMSNPAILTAFDSDDASKAVESGSSEIVALFAKLTELHGDGVYVAFHGFTCDAPKNKTFDISASRINEFEILAVKTVQTSPNTGLMAMYFRSTTTESGKLIEEVHGLVDYNGLVEQIKSQVGKTENYLHFYTYKQGNFIPLKKKNDEYSELKDEACQLIGTTSSERLSTYCTHILSKIIAIKAKNAILFVNGYDITKPITTNEVLAYDAINYWEGIDMLFKDRRRSTACFYANGNMSISTSNHQNAVQFGLSLNSMSSLVPILNTTPNTQGFKTRVESGRVAGQKLVTLLINAGYAAMDTLDIVCHSMGFAYAQGMLESLLSAIAANRLHIQLGGYYIIAPENPSCGTVDIKQWQQIWQYGSNEQMDDIRQQDGVAPQGPVGNIGTNRAFIPITAPKGFYDSHAIENYKWIFIRKDYEPGYVTSR